MAMDLINQRKNVKGAEKQGHLGYMTNAVKQYVNGERDRASKESLSEDKGILQEKWSVSKAKRSQER